jgi:2-polyprenyl-3-methyl-5-hydroxy-6-metoxy-1,4-benzoquinol methylase
MSVNSWGRWTMAKFHFVEDYEKHVADLTSCHPIDEAMSLAVGGGYDHIGRVELAILKHVGLCDGMALIDLGCGSGRLATALEPSGLAIDYLGIDIVQALLDYAQTRAPSNYRFVLHRQLDLPADAETMEIVCAFDFFYAPTPRGKLFVSRGYPSSSETERNAGVLLS